jgi:hypothetical protein
LTASRSSEKFLTPEVRQSGLPLGFRDVVVKNASGRKRGNVVPEKGDVVEMRRRTRLA